MARVVLRSEIEGISGIIGNTLFKTMKDGRVFMYQAPVYQRRKPLTKGEIAARRLMIKRHARVVELMKGGKTRREAWAIAKQEITM